MAHDLAVQTCLNWEPISSTFQKQISNKSLANNPVLTTPLLVGPCLRKDLLNSMLATSCQEGHLDVVRLLVQSYDADAKDCAIHSDEFAVITGLPLYAASQASKDILTQESRKQ